MSTVETASQAKSLHSKADSAYSHIKDSIVRGDYSPGYRLVLSTIAHSLNMSVVPVREAIRRLEAEGLVTFQRNVGASVSVVDESEYRMTMETLGMLEGVATGKAIPYITDSDIEKAFKINQEMEASLDNLDPETFTQKNHEFHLALYNRCPNTRLKELTSIEWERLSHLRSSTFSKIPQRARESVREHYEILELIRSGAEAIEIEKAVRTHRLATLATYLEKQSKAFARHA